MLPAIKAKAEFHVVPRPPARKNCFLEAMPSMPHAVSGPCKFPDTVHPSIGSQLPMPLHKGNPAILAKMPLNLGQHFDGMVNGFSDALASLALIIVT